MGVFSSKKKTYVSTTVARVVEDNQVPDLRQRNLIDSVFQDKRLTHTIVSNALKSHATKVERAYRYAARGDYVYGTPNHNVLNAADGQDTLKNILETEHNTAVRLDYFQFAPLNNLHVGWQRLTEDYGYDEFTNEVTVLSDQWGQKVWVKDLVGHINTQAMTSDDTAETPQERSPDDGTLAVWGRHPQDRYTPFRDGSPKTPVWLLDPTVTDGVMVHLVAEDGTEDTLFFDLSGYDEDLENFHAKYRYIEDGVRKIGYFTYQYGAGAYPALDAVHAGAPVTDGTFFPVVLFRHNDTNRTDPAYHDTEEYQSTSRLMDIMGMDFQELGDSIHENPDVDKLDQAVMMFAVPAATEDAAEKEYLFKFFNWLYLQSPRTQRIASLDSVEFSRPGQAIRIKDADFDCTLSFSKLRRKRVAGTVGERGTYHQAIVQETRTRTVWRRVYNAEDRAYETQKVEETYTVDLMQYRHQVTAASYDEILVEGLQVRYNIYGNKGVTANVTSDKLLIPLDYTIARTLRYDRKERLYYRAMHFVLNSRVTVTVKWYERDFFKFVLFVAAVAITIFTGGLAGPIAAAWAAGAYTAVAIMILMAAVYTFAMQKITEQVLELVGSELGYEATMVLAVVAFAVGAYGSFNGLDWGTMAIQAANGLAKASQYAMRDALMEYQSKSQEFQLLAEEKMEELEEIENLLNQYDLLDPRSFIGRVPDIRLGESPDNLYDRTVHNGNPGILQYDYIESFVDINTQLPTFHDLVGDTFYGRI